MGFIFNKRVIDATGNEYNDYEPELVRFLNSAKLEEKAMAINLICDHRVSMERELNFRKNYFEPLGKDLMAALRQHANREIKFRPDPEFCKSYCNSFVADCSDPTSVICVGVAEKTELVTIVNLNSLGRAFFLTPPDIINSIPMLSDSNSIERDSIYFLSRTRRLIPTIDGDTEIQPTAFDDWIDDRMSGTLHEVQAFVQAVFELMRIRMDHDQFYNPVWVTKWDDFSQYAGILRSDGSLDVDRWNQVVGVRSPLNTWQIVLKYPARKVGCLYRPTILDGGFDYAQHFPSPPEQLKHMGGITMDLGAPDSVMLPEFIHKQIVWDIDYWIAAGKLFGQTRIGRYSDKLTRNRTDHHQKLKNHFSQLSIENWMAAPI